MMISRALLVALWCTLARALAPLAAPADDECALYLTGPGRTSAYDYSLNLLKGNFGYDAQHTCITYDAINQAYLDARNRILVSQPKGDWKAEDFASVGELILDVSISLARTYGLTYEEIEKALPLIDTSRTLIREVCPPVFSHVECRPGKYRRLDGLCNNLQHPTWGATMAPFQRLIGPLFSDGINAPRIAHTGRDLPLSRVVSRTMHPDEGFHDHAGTVMVIAWGQFMDHDYTLTGTPLDPINRNDPEECCKRPPHLKHPYCNEIRIPDDDYFYRLFGVKCIDFVRGFPSPRPGCRLGSRVPFNTLTGAIDGNTVYGVTEKFSRKLRTGYGGLLRMNPVFKEYGLKDLLPLKLDIPDEGCTRPNKNMYCFEAGEIRVNEQLVLTVMHTLMAREHNRVAEALAHVNPHWDDETLFQEARRINIAEIQHITYNEFLPILLGKDVMEKFGLVLEKEGYWEGYDPEVNPDVLASFAAAAYRFGHSLLPTAVERWSKAHKFIASKRLSDLIRRPYDLYRAGVLDEYVMGLMNQVAQAMDDSITQEVTNHLFKKVGARFGMDLVSFNMQRGREFGLPGYMEFRKFCGLSGADTFQDLFGSMPNETVHRYESIFEHPIDVDLWSGGVSERPLPGSMLGPTFACIIATQFSYSRRGDRFWFELPNQPSSFTPEQLVELRKARLARVICDNTDIIDTVQLYPMVLPDHELNPRVPCRSGIIPSMDFSKWADPVPFHGAAKQFMTVAYAENNTISCMNQNGKNTSSTSCGINKINNDTSDSYPSLIDLSKINITVTNITDKIENNTLSNITIHDCTSDNTLLTKECANKQNESNNITKDIDTVLKYVYVNKGALKQSTGHPKNSLKRKKRSSESNDYTIGNVSPVTINYEPLHTPREREELGESEEKPSVIKSSALADFNIETLHDVIEPTQSIVNQQNSYKNIIDDENQATDNSESREESGDRITKSNEEYSNEEEKEPNFKNNYAPEDSNESIENSSTRNLHDSYREEQRSNESGENINDSQNYKTQSKNEDSNESNEHSVESAQGEKYNNNYVNSDISSGKPTSEENGSKEKDDEKKFSSKPSDDNESFKSTEQPKNIQEVDLDDFSYERVHVNNKGKVEPLKETNNNYVNDPLAIVPLTIKPDIDNDNERYTTDSKEISKSSEEDSDSNENTNQPTPINDGEVRPVVELNSEDESEESSDNNSRELLNAHLETENKDRHPIEEIQSKNKDGKENSDVKQEFERIPLDYNHATSKKNNDQKSKEIPIKDTEHDENEGTLDTLSPKKNRYDDNLNFKFSDVSIKLPEIKLPENVLEYTQEELPHNNEKPDDKKFFYYDDEEESEEDSEERPKNYNDNKKYYNYGYRNKNDHENIQKKPSNNKHNDEESDDESEEDLYEKFVRERFGKRGSFNKRSEKLQDSTYRTKDPKLYETLQNILKKTEQVQKQAEKSGDPNAGYLWTLEYGENL